MSHRLQRACRFWMACGVRLLGGEGDFYTLSPTVVGGGAAGALSKTKAHFSKVMQSAGGENKRSLPLGRKCRLPPWCLAPQPNRVLLLAGGGWRQARNRCWRKEMVYSMGSSEAGRPSLTAPLLREAARCGRGPLNPLLKHGDGYDPGDSLGGRCWV